MLPATEFTAPLVTQILSALKEGVINEHLRGPSTVDILVKALVDEVLEVIGPLGRDGRRVVLDNIEKHASVVL